mmetsp:Transcript_25914/g.71346  ORF Transcript_25914/g.71346 Transcript_25914/m.71346 type:complete len:90 (-) Transcript_25914:69-338(-)
MAVNGTTLIHRIATLTSAKLMKMPQVKQRAKNAASVPTVRTRTKVGETTMVTVVIGMQITLVGEAQQTLGTLLGRTAACVAVAIASQEK